jgi:ABC-type Co2+ transport system permease subunit
MKKRMQNLKKFTRRIGKGMHIELKETIEIPSLLIRREYKKAGAQVVDIFKMTGLAVVWVIPGGAVITAVILKFSHKMRPSAFRSKEERKPLSDEKKS